MMVKTKGGQKMDEGVKISKSNILPIMLKMTYLHNRSALVNSTVFILSAVSLFTNFGCGVK